MAMANGFLIIENGFISLICWCFYWLAYYSFIYWQHFLYGQTKVHKRLFADVGFPNLFTLPIRIGPGLHFLDIGNTVPVGIKVGGDFLLGFNINDLTAASHIEAEQRQDGCLGLRFMQLIAEIDNIGMPFAVLAVGSQAMEDVGAGAEGVFLLRGKGDITQTAGGLGRHRNNIVIGVFHAPLDDLVIGIVPGGTVILEQAETVQ